jgi:transposase
MAKSVADVSWSSFRAMLAYKAIKHGAWFEEVNESFSSQVCSSCGTLPDSRPRGIADLGVRRWVCSGCGVVHDRDTNAALNILARHGHVPPVEGIPVL